VLPRFRLRSGRLLILVVLVVVAVVLPAGAALLDRGEPGNRLEPLTPPSSAPVAAQSYPPGTPAPALKLPALDGGQVDLTALRGRPVVVNFWASWCVPCYQEHPVLLRAARAHGARVQFLGVVYDDEEARIRDFLSQVGTAYPSLLDVNGRTAIAYGVYGVPETYFIDAQGQIVHKYTGPLDDATMRDGLDRIAPRAAAEAR
jgi:cytochrome c biogenesis protein CcmG/thiol:disulfide interchange protein DsbE